jgi:plasmid segregation protein ParM
LIISVDLGYGYVKAVSEKTEILFPSVVAPATNQIFNFDETIQTKHIALLRSPGRQDSTSYYVGDKAIQEARAAQMSLAKARHKNNLAMILTATAAYLSGAKGNITLGYGVPLSYFRTQKDEVVGAFKGKEIYIKVDNGPERVIRFSDVHIFPQGVGVLFNDKKIVVDSLVGVIDIGYYTTDYLLTEISKDGFNPLYNYMSSIEIGVHTAQKHFASLVQSVTGKAMSLIEVQRYWERDSMSFAGQKIDLTDIKKESVKAAGQALVDSIIAAWSEKIDYLDDTILAGGGALEFLDIIKDNIRGTRVTANSQFSNANGFYNMARKKQEILRAAL